MGDWITILFPALGRRLYPWMLAEEIILGDRGEGGVGVGAAGHPELEGVDAELLLELQADFQSGARILILKHFVLFELGAVQVGIVPGLDNRRTRHWATGRDVPRRHP